MKKKSKRFKKLIDLKKKEQVKTLENKIDLIKKMSNTKFVESIDLSFKINLKKVKGADTNLRTIIELPNGSGKKFKVAVLCEPDKIEEGKKKLVDFPEGENRIFWQIFKIFQKHRRIASDKSEKLTRTAQNRMEQGEIL